MNGNGIDPTFGINDAPGLVISEWYMDNDDEIKLTPLDKPIDIQYYPPAPLPPLLEHNFLDTINTDDIKRVMGGAEDNFPGDSLCQSAFLQHQDVKGEKIINEVIDKELESFTNRYDNIGICIEESTRLRSKPYEIEDNILFTKPLEAVKIKVSGAQSGHIVKMTMRYTNETHYSHPVQVCMNHKDPKADNPGSTFFVVKKTRVRYTEESGHPTAIVTVATPMDGEFCFSPIFRCWNSCGKNFGKSQEMILSLCDIMTDEELYRTKFDVRVCENVGRDLRQYRDERAGKRPKKSPSKRSRNEAQVCETLQEIDQACAGMVMPSSRTHYFMVMQEGDELVPALNELAKVKGKMVEIEPTFHPERYFQ